MWKQTIIKYKVIIAQWLHEFWSLISIVQRINDRDIILHKQPKLFPLGGIGYMDEHRHNIYRQIFDLLSFLSSILQICSTHAQITQNKILSIIFSTISRTTTFFLMHSFLILSRVSTYPLLTLQRGYIICKTDVSWHWLLDMLRKNIQNKGGSKLILSAVI